MLSSRNPFGYLFFACLFAFYSRASEAQELLFKDHGRFVKKLSLNDLKGIARPQRLRVYESHEGHKQIYEGLPTNTILDAVYRDRWKLAEEILFTCADGYQPSIPVVRFSNASSFLAFSREGGPFTLINRLQNNEKVSLGPFYLIWDNLRFPDQKMENGGSWPYQVVAIDLIQFQDRFPKMAPPRDSSDQVKRGFLVFRSECMTCHSINGEGGKKGPDLNLPMSVTARMDENRLRQWITDPRKLRPNTTMPAFNQTKKAPARRLDDLIEYLKAMNRKT